MPLVSVRIVCGNRGSAHSLATAASDNGPSASNSHADRSKTAASLIAPAHFMRCDQFSPVARFSQLIFCPPTSNNLTHGYWPMRTTAAGLRSKADEVGLRWALPGMLSSLHMLAL